MVVKYWQAALLAAMMALAGNAARAQEVCPAGGFATGYAPPDCCKQENCTVLFSGVKKCCDAKDCCKDGACCKKKGDGKGCSCCKDEEDCKNCPCSKDKDCCKNCECCKGKDCACCKSKECCKGSCKCCDANKDIRIDVNEANTGSLIFGVGVNSNSGLIGSIVLNERNCDVCPAKCKQAKIVAIGRPTLAVVMTAPVHHADGSISFHPTHVKVVPAPMMPLCVGGPIAPPCVIHHGPLPGSNCVVMPHPLPPPPPMLTPPGLPVPAMTSPVMPPQTVGMPVPPPPPPTACCPCPMAAPPVCAAPPCPAAPATNSGLNLDNCLSILGMVSDLCYAHLHPTSLPGMCVSSLGMLMDLCPQSTAPAQQPEPGGRYESTATLLPPPRPDCPAPFSTNVPPPVVPCVVAAPTPRADAIEVRVASKPDSDQLEMSVGDDSCLSCKKMTVTVGDSEITLTRRDDRVRVRCEDLKATAACVRTDRKNRLILEGDVHLRYHKDDHQHASINAECIELDLNTGSVTIKSVGAGAPYYAPVHTEGVIVP